MIMILMFLLFESRPLKNTQKIIQYKTHQVKFFIIFIINTQFIVIDLELNIIIIIIFRIFPNFIIISMEMTKWSSVYILLLIATHTYSKLWVNVTNTLTFPSNFLFIQSVNINGFLIHLDDATLKLYDQNFVFIQSLDGPGVLFSEISPLETNRSHFSLYSAQSSTYCIYELNTTTFTNYSFICSNFSGVLAIKMIAPKTLIIVTNTTVFHLFWNDTLSEIIQTFIGSLSFLPYAVIFTETITNYRYQFLTMEVRTSLAGTLYSGNDTVIIGSSDIVSLISPISSNAAIFTQYCNGLGFVIQNEFFRTFILDLNGNGFNHYVTSINQTQQISSIQVDTLSNITQIYAIYQTKIGLISLNSTSYTENILINNDIPIQFRMSKNSIRSFYGYGKGSPILYKIMELPISPIVSSGACLNIQCSLCTYSQYLCNSCATGYTLQQFQCLPTTLPNNNTSKNSANNTAPNNDNKSNVSNINTIAVFFLEGTRKTIGYFNSFPNSRVYFKMIAPFFIVLDDYWYYDYHSQNLTWISQTFVTEIMKTNDQKFVPPYISIDQFQNALSISHILTSNYSSYTPTKLKIRSQMDIEFLRNTEQLYIWNYILIAVLFLIMRIITEILRCINSRINLRVLNFIYIIFYNRTRKQTLLVSAIEANIIFIAFNASIQFKTPFHFVFLDKINFIISTIFLFIALIFVIAFYPLLYRYSRNAYKFFSASKITEYYFIVNENSIINIKLLIYGLLHGYLIDQANFLFYCLILWKIVLIFLTIYSAKTFQTSAIFLFSLNYYVFSTLFDISFLIQLYYPEIVSIYWVYLDITVILVIILSIILKFITTTYFEIKTSLRKCFKSNKVANEIQEQCDIKQSNSSKSSELSENLGEKQSQQQSESKLQQSRADYYQSSSSSYVMKKNKIEIQSVQSENSVNQVKNIFPILKRLNKCQVHIAETPQEYQKRYNITFELNKKQEEQKI